MADVIKTTFQVKRGTAARWEELNLILNPGEPGFEIDPFKLKIGNGSTPWKELPYVNHIDIATNDDAMDLLAEMGMTTPVTNSNGEILTSSSNEIYSL